MTWSPRRTFPPWCIYTRSLELLVSSKRNKWAWCRRQRPRTYKWIDISQGRKNSWTIRQVFLHLLHITLFVMHMMWRPKFWYIQNVELTNEKHQARQQSDKRTHLYFVGMLYSGYLSFSIFASSIIVTSSEEQMYRPWASGCSRRKIWAKHRSSRCTSWICFKIE